MGIANELYDKMKEGQRCVDMLLLCGESGGKKQNETPSEYLRRLIDDLIRAERWCKAHDMGQ